MKHSRGREFDLAIVGGGILGLAHAYHASKAGRSVVLFERGSRATGASIRNFGMIWPIGQPIGPRRDLGLRSREHWLRILKATRAWYQETGSLHLAYESDESAVLEEFFGLFRGELAGSSLCDASEVLRRAPLVRADGLRVGLWSPWEICVDPREVIPTISDWLAEAFGVQLQFGQTVVGVEPGKLWVGKETWRAESIVICPGDDLRTLFPELFQGLPLTRCKLQMLRSEPLPPPVRLGPMLAGGLTLRHYESFEPCPSLPALRERFRESSPEFDQYGIHVMASQNGVGELVLGDSHQYGDEFDPFDSEEIDQLILSYLMRFLNLPSLQIASRWHGIYAKAPGQHQLVLEPDERIRIVTGVGGAGMTLSFGIAEEVIAQLI